MRNQYRMYGSQMSYYAAKLRAYMDYKRLDYHEKPFSIYDVRWRLPKNAGSSGIPALETSSGEWLSDTTEIIEALEARHPEPTLSVKTPVQRVASMLIEAWCDDVWLPAAVHTRWSYPENYPIFREVVGKGLVPYAPRSLRDWVVDNTAARFARGKLKDLGAVAEQIDLLDQWTSSTLDVLERHLASHAFLFGSRPTIADYALFGPLYGHFYMDPVSRRNLVEPRRALKCYIERLNRGDRGNGDLVANDEIPATLLPLFEIIFSEFYPMLDELVIAVREKVDDEGLVGGDPVPRFFKNVSFPMCERQYSRIGLSYTLWMMQRIQKHCETLNREESEAVSSWFASMGQRDLTDKDMGPPVDRDGLGVRLAG